MIADFDFAAVSIQENLVPKKGGAQGAKIAPILYQRKPLKIILGSIEEPVRIPFEIGTFDKGPNAVRVNIVFEVNNAAFQDFSKSLMKQL